MQKNTKEITKIKKIRKNHVTGEDFRLSGWLAGGSERPRSTKKKSRKIKEIRKIMYLSHFFDPIPKNLQKITTVCQNGGGALWSRSILADSRDFLKVLGYGVEKV